MSSPAFSFTLTLTGLSLVPPTVPLTATTATYMQALINYQLYLNNVCDTWAAYVYLGICIVNQYS